MRQKGSDPTPTPGPGSNAICSSTLVSAHMDVCTTAHDPWAGLGATSGERQRQPSQVPFHSTSCLEHPSRSSPFGAELREHSATDCPQAAPAHCDLCSSSTGSSSSSVLATLSNHECSDGAAHGTVPVKTSLSPAGSPELSRCIQPSTVSDLSWQTHILTVLHIARLSWSHQLVWDVSFVCRGSQVICKSLPKQASLAGKDASRSAEPTTSQPGAFTYVVLPALGTTWLHPVLKKTNFRPVQVVWLVTTKARH